MKCIRNTSYGLMISYGAQIGTWRTWQVVQIRVGYICIPSFKFACLQGGPTEAPSEARAIEPHDSVATKERRRVPANDFMARSACIWPPAVPRLGVSTVTSLSGEISGLVRSSGALKLDKGGKERGREKKKKSTCQTTVPANLRVER